MNIELMKDRKTRDSFDEAGKRVYQQALAKGLAWIPALGMSGSKWLVLLMCAIALGLPGKAYSTVEEKTPPILLRAWGVPDGISLDPMDVAARKVMDEFRRENPHVEPVPTAGLRLPGSKSMDMVPFMQIAGDLAPDVIYVNFRQSQTYIDMKLLYPLDHYVERKVGVTLADGSSLNNEQYLTALKRGGDWAGMSDSTIETCWPVMRRICPYKGKCPYRNSEGLAPMAEHYHVWAFPVAPKATAMQFDRTLLAEHADEGIELRTPRDWDELIRWAKSLTNPAKNEYGLEVSVAVPGWTYANFLYAAGGRVVEQDGNGQWRAVIDSPQAVEAAYFWARLRHEKVIHDGREITRGVVKAGESGAVSGQNRFGFKFVYLDEQFFKVATDQTQGLGAVPAGPTGLRRSEFNANMLGIFSGLGKDVTKRDAAWAYIQFLGGQTSQRIRTETMVDAGLGPYVQRLLLERFNDGGRYDSVIRQIPNGLEETYSTAFSGGVPEPYGKNCQYVYDELSKPLGAIWNSKTIRDAIDAGDADAAKAEIRGILQRANTRINAKMIGLLTPQQQSTRNRVAWVAISLVTIIFIFVLRSVFRVFTPPELLDRRMKRGRKRRTLAIFRMLRRDSGGAINDSMERVKDAGAEANEDISDKVMISEPALRKEGILSWRNRRYINAWVLMTPALLLIAIWSYWPVIRGTVIAFQNYSVSGDNEYVGASNFAAVLFSGEFWYSLRISLTYAVLFFIFGFWAPIGLALLLSEVPRGGVVYRTIYYLPAVLSGVVVLFLWKSFYGSGGMVNSILNQIVWVLNLLPGVNIGLFNQDWLQNPYFALFFCLLPTVWAGMGPGCLIYLAALKTIPEELYEAADIDGASIVHKLFFISIPAIRVLIMINFIGAIIGAIRGSGGFMLAMTGGGPYGESGGATEVIGLKIFYTTFGYLQFGVGAAMAWVLGAMLIGFTVFQLKRMSTIEFHTTRG